MTNMENELLLHILDGWERRLDETYEESDKAVRNLNTESSVNDFDWCHNNLDSLHYLRAEVLNLIERIKRDQQLQNKVIKRDS